MADFGFGHLRAPRHELLHLGLGLGRDPFGFGLGAGDDLGGFTFGFLLLAFVLREQRLRLFLEPPRLVELLLYAGVAFVEGRHRFLMNPQIDHEPDEQDEGDRNPEFGVEHLRSSALENLSDRAGDLRGGGCGAGQPLDNRGGRLDRDSVHIRHGGGAGRGDGLFSFGDAGIEAGI